MTEPLAATPPAPEPAPKPKLLSTKARWIVALVAVALLAAVAVLNSTFTMQGSISGSCYSFRTTLNTGDEVTVYDETGDIIGHGTLGTPMGIGSDCSYPFVVEHVPNFKSAYSIQIGQLVNRVTFDRDRAEYPSLINN